MPARQTAPHFARALPAFLGQLERHNDRTWFEAHREEYEAVLVEPAKAFVEVMAEALRKLAPGLNADPSFNGSIVRMNRDTRFSKDKTPYKTSLHLRFWYGPDKKTSPAFHVGIGANHLGIGVGAYAFAPDQLARYRDAVAAPKSGAALVRALAKAEKPPGTERRGLHYKKVPRGFDADDPNAELLRHAGLFTACESALPTELFGAKASQHIIGRFRPGLPLVQWLAEHVGPSRARKGR